MNLEADILALSAAWDEALVANDAGAVANFMADDWVYAGPTGATPKADLIGWIRSGRLAHHTMEVVGAPRVAVYGDSVVVSGRKTSSGSWEGTAYTADEWISEVLIRSSGRWLCVLSHKCAAE